MAVERDSKPPVNRVNTEFLEDFSGGLNSTISGSLLNKNEAQKAQDVSFEQKGTIRPRKGRRKRYAAPFSSTPCTGLGAYYKMDGTARLIVTSYESIYSDKPNISSKWGTTEDFNDVNTVKSFYVNGADNALKFRNNEIRVGDCEDITKWTAVDGTLTLDTTSKHFNDASIELEIAADKTVAFMQNAFMLALGKHWCISGYIKNIDAASGGRLVISKEVTGVQTPIKGSSYVTATTFTKAILKLSPTDLVTVEDFGFEVKGLATQSALVDGIVINEITEDDYNNAEYVPPDYSDLEVVKTAYVIDTDAEWNAGTKTNLVVASNTVKCDIGASQDEADDLTGGTNSENIRITDDLMDLIIPGTWEDLSVTTWDELILE